MKLTIYHYPACDTCRKAIKWLEARGWELEKRNIADTPPSAGEMAQLVRRSGLGIRRFFNVSGNVYKEMNLKDKLPGMTEEDMCALLASNGMLIKRPVVTDGRRVTVGFREDEFQAAWGSGAR